MHGTVVGSGLFEVLSALGLSIQQIALELGSSHESDLMLPYSRDFMGLLSFESCESLNRHINKIAKSYY